MYRHPHLHLPDLQDLLYCCSVLFVIRDPRLFALPPLWSIPGLALSLFGAACRLLQGLSWRRGFARPGDFVKDDLSVLRSDLAWAINGSWDLRWQLAHRSASQDFDHYFGGTYDAATRLLGQNYAWQETANKTLSSALTLNGRFATGAIEHKLTAGLDWSREKRDPLLSSRSDQPINPFAAPGTWGRLNPRPAATIDNHHRAHSSGLFVQDLISLRPDVKVLVGGRHDRYKFRSTNIQTP